MSTWPRLRGVIFGYVDLLKVKEIIYLIPWPALKKKAVADIVPPCYPGRLTHIRERSLFKREHLAGHTF